MFCSFETSEPVYRLAEKEWVAFVDAWVTTLVEVDDEIPPLPPKDVIHRIYRDVSLILRSGPPDRT